MLEGWIHTFMLLVGLHLLRDLLMKPLVFFRSLLESAAALVAFGVTVGFGG